MINVAVARSTDFENTALRDWGVTVSRTPVTKTVSNIEGDETLTDGTPEDILAVFHKKKADYAQSNEGLVITQNAYVMVSPTQTLNKDDTITYQGETWRIYNVVTRGPAGSVALYTYADMFLIS